MLENNCHIIEEENKSQGGRNSRMDYLERTETPFSICSLKSPKNVVEGGTMILRRPGLRMGDAISTGSNVTRNTDISEWKNLDDTS